MAEITTRELRFTASEAETLLNEDQGLGLEPAEVERLLERTEGWPAGLYLAALSLRGRADKHEFIDDFAGDDRHLVDYLTAEVLSGQTDELRQFLLVTSLLDRFNASLCDAVTQTDRSAQILREIETSNLFLVPLDDRREWYRYHHLFGELLRHELRAGSAGPGGRRAPQGSSLVAGGGISVGGDHAPASSAGLSDCGRVDR